MLNRTFLDRVNRVNWRWILISLALVSLGLTQEGELAAAEGRLSIDDEVLKFFPEDEPIAGSFAWKEDGSCEIKLCAFETPFVITLNLKFEGEQAVLNSESNVAFGPTKRPVLIGRK